MNVPNKIGFFMKDSQSIVQSPMNYIGGKGRLLPQLLPHFPSKIDRFIDVFSGGANVAANTPTKDIILNDINFYIMDIIKYFYNVEVLEILEEIDYYINKYKLSKYNKEGYLQLRSEYNKSPHPIKLYTLICYSFNYQFRFNNNHEFNNPFGKNRSHFSQKLREKLIKFSLRLKEKNILFDTNEFQNFLESFEFQEFDFVYLDPPYLISTASYNDGNRGFKNWTVEQEKLLFSVLDQLNNQNIRFALSNVTEHKGKKNELLIEWSKKYNVIKLNFSYSNSSHNTKRGHSSEVLITNF